MPRAKGRCLCGALTYEIDGEIDGIWMCHCSLCQKASGSTGLAIVIVPRAAFRWLTGEDHRVTYALRPSYTITRCKTCGTPLPAEEDGAKLYLTAGTLDEPLGDGVKGHLFCGSRGAWDHDMPGAPYFVERSSGPTMSADQPKP
jgi:hypothetical protein